MKKNILFCSVMASLLTVILMFASQLQDKDRQIRSLATEVSRLRTITSRAAHLAEGKNAVIGVHPQQDGHTIIDVAWHEDDENCPACEGRSITVFDTYDPIK
jgi:hypothetical protein